MLRYEVQYDRWVSINVLKKRKTSDVRCPYEIRSLYLLIPT